MVAIVSGNTLGVSLGSLSTLGQRGTFGNSGSGRSGELAYVNAATGNLVLQGHDAHWSSRGLNIETVRTYNSLGLFNDDNGDNWSLGFARRVYGLTGTVNTSGSTITRRSQDGAEAVYTWNAANGRYESMAGAGAVDTLAYATTSKVWTWTDGSTGVIEKYDESNNGCLTSISDPSGNTLTLSSNAQGQIVYVVDANGARTYYDYAGTQLTQVRTTGPDGANVVRVRYAYDASNRLSSVTVDLSPEDGSIADGKTYVTTYTYHGSSKRVFTITQSDRTSLTIDYVQVGADWRVRTVRDALGNTTTFSYDTTNRRTTVIDALSQSTVYNYDAQGQLIQVTSPAVNGVSATTRFVYNTTGDVSQVIDGEGRAVDMQYDARGNLTMQRDSAGNTVLRTYDARNQLLTETVPTDGNKPVIPLAAGGIVSDDRLTVANDTITKTGGGEGWDTGFRSREGFSSGAYVSFVAAQVDKPVMVGLNSDPDTNNSYSSIDYALYLRGDGTLAAYESGSWKQNLGSYAAGDTFAVAYDGTRIVYMRNGIALRTLTATITQPLYVDSSFHSIGAKITDLQFGECPFVNDNGMTLVGTSASKTSGVNGSWDSGFGSKVGYVNGASVSYVVPRSDHYLMVGLNTDPTANSNYTSIDWALYSRGNGTLRVYESGVYKGDLGTYTAGDTLAVTYVGGYIRYYKNGVVLRSVAANITRPLYADASFNTVGAQITNLKFGEVSFSPAPAGNVAVVGNTATKVSGPDAWEAALSTVGYTGGAAVSYVVSENDKQLSVGLLNPQSPPSFNIQCRSDGTLCAVEYDQVVAQEFGTYAAGDALAVTYDGAYVRYLKNGQVLRAVAANISLPLHASVALYSVGAQVANLKFSEMVLVADANVSVVHDAVTKTSGVNGSWDAGFHSKVGYAGSAAVSYVVPRKDKYLMVGLNSDPTTNSSYTTMDWALYCRGTGSLCVYENGANVQELGTYSAGDVFAVTYDGAYVRYFKNGVVLRAVAAKITAPLYADASFHTIGASITDVKFGAAMAARTRYVYDGGNRNLLRFVISPEGRVTEHRYNGYGERIASVQYAGELFPVGTLAEGGVPTETELTNWVAAQDKTRTERQDFVYDVTGQLKSSTSYASVNASGVGITDGTQSTTQYVYDPTGRLLSTVTPNGHTTQYTYDGLGRMLTATNLALNETTVTQYDDANNKTKITSVNGLVTTSTYDRAGRLVSVLQGNSAAVNLGEAKSYYDADSRLRMTVDATGVRRWFVYDEADRQVAEIDALGQVTEYIYDKNNQVTQTIAYANAISVSALVGVDGSPLNVTLTGVRPAASTSDRKSWRAYDAANRLVKTVSASGEVLEMVYDGASRVVATTRYANTTDTTSLGIAPSPETISPIASTWDRTERSFYDDDGLLLGTLNASGSLTESLRDASGRVTATVLHANAAAPGTTLEQARPMGSAGDSRTLYFYNAKGQVFATLDADNFLTETSYDANGNVSNTWRYAAKITSPVSTATPVANLRQGPAEEQATYGYDPLNRVLSKRIDPAGVNLTTTYAYDNVNNTLSVTDPAGTVTVTTFDVKGQALSVVVDPNGLNVGTSTTYDNAGRVLTVTDANGVVTRYTYDALGRKASAEVDPSGLNVVTRYSYDTAGNLARTVNAAGHQTRYVYDANNRLRYTLDAEYGLTENVYNELGQVERTVRYAERQEDIQTRILPNGAIANSFASITPNAAKDQITRYAYDKNGRVVYAIDATNAVTQQRYDAAGNLIEKIRFAVPLTSVPVTLTPDTVFQALQVSPTLDQSTRFIYDALHRLRFTVDAVGSVTETVYDYAGNVVQTVAYANTANRSLITDVTMPSDIIIGKPGIGRAVVTDPRRDRISYFLYDKAGRQTFSIDSTGAVTERRYDKLGRVVQTIEYARPVGRNLVALPYNVDQRVVASPSEDAGLPAGNTVYLTTDRDGFVSGKFSVTAGEQIDVSVEALREQNSPSSQFGIGLYYSRDGSEWDRFDRAAVLEAGRTTGVISGRLTVPDGFKYAAVMVHLDGPWGQTGSRYFRSVEAIRVSAADDGLPSTSDVGAMLKQQLSGSEADRVSYFAYDAANRQVLAIDANGAATETQYDAVGHVTSTKTYENKTSKGVLDALADDPNGAALNRGFISNTVSNSSMGVDGDPTDFSTGVDLHPAWAVPGEPTLWLSQIGTAATSAYLTTAPISVTAGKRYEFSAYTGAHRATASIEVVFFDAAGRSISTLKPSGGVSTNAAELAGGPTLAGYKKLWGFVTAPTGAVSARLQLRKAPTNAGSGDSFLFATHLYAGEATASQTSASPLDLHPVVNSPSLLKGGLSSGWTLQVDGTSTDFTSGTNLNSTWSIPGDSTLWMRQGGTVPVSAYFASPAVGVTAGSSYDVSIYTGAHRATTTLEVAFFDAAGNELATVAPTGGVISNASEMSGGTMLARYKRLWGTVKAPDKAVTAQVRVRKAPTNEGQTNSYAFIVQGYFGEAPPDRVTRYAYDRVGRRTYTTDPAGAVTHQRYDNSGNVVETVRYGQHYAGAVDDESLTAFYANPANRTATDQRTLIVYDAANRPVLTIDPTSAVTETQYDAFGRITSTRQYANGAPKGVVEELATDPNAATLNRGFLSNTISNSSMGVDGDPTGFTSYMDAGFQGQPTLRLNQSGTAASSSYLATAPIGVTAGKRYEFSAYTGAMHATASIEVVFFDATGKKIGTFTPSGGVTTNASERPGGMTGGSSLAGYKKLWGFVTAPTGAASARMQLRKAPTNVGETQSSLEVMHLYTGEASENQTADSPLDLHPVVNAPPLLYRWGSWTQGVDGASTDFTSGVNLNSTWSIAGDATPWLRQGGTAPTSSYLASHPVSVIAGRSYDVSVYTGAHRSTASLEVAFYDAAGNELATVIPTGGATSNAYELLGGTKLASYKQLWGAAEAPDGAATARVRVRKGPTYEGKSDSYLFITQSYFGEVPADRVTHYAYDQEGRRTYAVDPTGAVMRQRYDAYGNVVETIRYGKPYSGAVDNESLTSFYGNVANQTSSDQHTRIFYDAANRPVLTIDAVGAATETQYDAHGHVIGTRQYASAVSKGVLDALAADANGAALNRGFISNTVSNSSMGVDGDPTGFSTGVDLNPAWAVPGEPTLWLRQIGTAATSAYLTTAPISVTAGKRYEFSAYTGAHRATASIEVVFFDAAGRSISTLKPSGGVSTNAAELAGGPTLAGYKKLWGLVTAPTGAVSARLQLRKAPTDAGSGDSYLFATHLYAGEATASQTSASPLDLHPVVNSPSLLKGGLSSGWTLQVDGTSTDFTSGANLNSTWAIPGDPTLWMRQGGTAPISAYFASPAVGVTAGGSYDVSIYTGAHRATMTLEVAFFDAAGNELATVAPTGGVISNASEMSGGTMLARYKRLWGTVKAPDKAVTAQVRVRKAPTIEGQTNSYAFIVQSYFGETVADRVTRHAFDRDGRRTYMVDATGAVTRQRYDAHGRVVETIGYGQRYSGAVDDEALSTYYASASHQTSFDRSTRVVYDSAGFERYTIDALGGVVEKVYDTHGNVARTIAYDMPIDPARVNDATSPGDVRALLPTTAFSARETVYTRDLAGRVVHIATAVASHGDGNKLFTVTERQYNSTGDLAKTVAYSTRIALQDLPPVADIGDLASRITKDTAQDRTVDYFYDLNGRLIEKRDGEGYAERFTYDKLGNKTSYTNKNWATFTYRYDKAGRLTSEFSPYISTATLLDGYTIASKETHIETRLAYDAHGNLVSRTEAYGLPEQRTTRYTYDAVGQQTGVIYEPVRVYDRSRDNPSAHLVGRWLPGTEEEPLVSLSTQTVYDVFGQAVVNKDVGGNFSYKTYDKLGRVLTEVDAGHGVTRHEYSSTVGEYENFTRLDAKVSLADGFGVSAQSLNSLAAAASGIGRSREVSTRFDKLGREAKKIDLGNVWSYDSVTNESGWWQRETTFSYNVYGNVTSSSVLLDRVAGSERTATTRFAYDLKGDLVRKRDAEGFVTAYEKNAFGEDQYSTAYALAVHPSSDISTTPTQSGPSADSDWGHDRRQFTEYDRRGMVVADGFLNVLLDSVENGIPQRSAGNILNRYTLDGVGNVTKTFHYTTSPDDLSRYTSEGDRVFNKYDALGRLIRTMDGDFRVTDFGRDALGNAVVTRRFATLGWGTELPTQLAPRDEDWVSYQAFDALGRVVKTRDATGAERFFAYDAHGKVARQWTPFTDIDNNWYNSIQRFEYDALGQQTATETYVNRENQSPLLIRETAEYNNFGEIVAKYRNGEQVAYYDYDAGGRLWRTNSEGGVDKVYFYDLQDNATSVITASEQNLKDAQYSGPQTVPTPTLQQSARRTKNKYDRLGHLVEQTDLGVVHLDGNTTSKYVRQSYDAFGNVRSYTSTGNRATSYRYNVNNQLIQEIKPTTTIWHPDGTSDMGRPDTKYYYDAWGHNVGTTDARGYSNTATYSQAGLLRTEKRADNGVVRHYYNAFGLETQRDGAGNGEPNPQNSRSYLYEYDKAGRKTKEIVFGRQLKRPSSGGNYDPSLFKYDYSHFTLGSYTYDQLGNRTSETSGADDKKSNVQQKYVYDPAGRLVKSSNPIKEIHYAYNAAGQKVRETDALGQVSEWTYDVLGRLQSKVDIGGATTTFEYNRAGELTRQHSNRGQDIHYAYYEDGRVKTVTDHWNNTRSTYDYDADGNKVIDLFAVEALSSSPRLYRDVALSYDELNRVKTIRDSFTGSTSFPVYELTFQYDENGNRARVLGSSIQMDVTGGPLTINSATERRTVDMVYGYDPMNRVNRAGSWDGTIGTQRAWDFFYYDKEGLRIKHEKTFANDGNSGSLAGRVVYYNYDFASRVTETSVASTYVGSGEGVLRSHRKYLYESESMTEFQWAKDAAVDSFSFADAAPDRVYYTHNLFDDDGRTLSTVSHVAATTRYYWYNTSVVSNSYDRQGNLKSMAVHAYKVVGSGDSLGSSYSNTLEYKYTYLQMDGYLQNTATVSGSTWDGTVLQPNTTKLEYDVNGHLVQSSSSDGSNRQYLVTDTSGHVVTKLRNRVGQSIGDHAYTKTYNPEGDTHATSNTQQPPSKPAIIEVSASPGIDTSETQQRLLFADDQWIGTLTETHSSWRDTTGRWPLTLYRSKVSATFADALNPSAVQVSSGAGIEHTVQAGETLRTLAQSFYGDPSLWYVIGEANAIPDDEALVEGTVIRIPVVTRSSNTATTYKVYDPSSIIDNTNPDPIVPPPPPQDGGCGTLGTILVVVVAVVATVVTAGAALAAMSYTTVAGAAAAGATGMAALAASGAIGAAVGSIASQGVAMATGMQDKFNWKQVGLAAIGGAVSGGLSAVGSGGVAGAMGVQNASVASAINAAASNVITQGVAVATGLQDKFNWRSVAVSAMAAPMSASLTKAFGRSALGQAIGAQGAVAGRTAAGIIGGTVTQGIRMAVYNQGKLDFASIAADSFGNALGESLAASASGGSSQEEVLRQKAQEDFRRSEITQMNRDAVTEAAYEQLVGAFGNGSTPQGDTNGDILLAAGKGFSLGRGSRDAGAGRGFVNPPLVGEESGAVAGDGLKVDPSKLSRFWTNDSVGSRYAPSLGMKEVLDYFNPATRWEGFKEGFSISGVVDGVGQFLSDPIGSLERGGLAMQERTRQYFEAGRKGDFTAAARFEAELAGGEAAGLVVGFGVVKGAGLSVRAFNAVGGVTSDLISSSLSSSSVRLGTAGLGDATGGLGSVWTSSLDIRQSQQSISFAKRDDFGNVKYTLDDITRGLRDNPADPRLTIDVVRMPDGGLTTLDNSRPAVLNAQGGGKIQARIRAYDAPLSEADTFRFTAKRDGEVRIPSTWGEAVDYRIWKQGDQFVTRYPNGTGLVPKISGAPAGSIWSQFNQYPWKR